MNEWYEYTNFVPHRNLQIFFLWTKTFLYNGHDSIGRKFPTTTRVRSTWTRGRRYSSWECQKRLVWWWNRNYRDESVYRDRRAHMSLLRTTYLQTHELRTVQSIQRHFDRPLTAISFTSIQEDTSAIKVRLSSNWSLVHFVSRQNSFPTSAICPVRRQTTVGVPLYEINFSYSLKVNVALPIEKGEGTIRVRWKHFSINTRSSSLSVFVRAMKLGRYFAIATLIRNNSCFWNLRRRYFVNSWNPST